VVKVVFLFEALVDISLLLDHSEFFRGITPANKAALAAICVPRTLSKREMLFVEGDRGDAMYILASGNVQIYKSGPSGKESAIKTIGPGEIFAEVILFEQNVYPASAIALKKSLAYSIDKRLFLRLLADERFRNDFMRLLMQKQRYLISRIHDLTSGSVETRFIRFLEEQYGRRRDYRLLIPKKDIAQAIGATSETFSRLINRMQKDGTMTVKKDRIVMRDGFWDTVNEA
jgi:CRP/FNR family transcriptional regulator